MKKLEKMLQSVSKKIVDVSMDTAKNTVGKCHPLFVHEVKMPEGVKEIISNK